MRVPVTKTMDKDVHAPYRDIFCSLKPVHFFHFQGCR